MTPALTFAGGTDEIGASSLILDIGAERLVIEAMEGYGSLSAQPSEALSMTS